MCVEQDKMTAITPQHFLDGECCRTLCKPVISRGRSRVRAARLNSLVVYYSASLDEAGNLIPSGVIEVLP
jgi:hypothetical protein